MIDELTAIVPAPVARITLGEGDKARTINVRPLKVRQIPGVTRALRPLAGQIGALVNGGVTPDAVLELLEHHTEKVVEVLAEASDVPVDVLNDSDVDQLAGLLLAVITANKGFLSGRLIAALQTAGNAMRAGDGSTPSKP